MRETTFVVTILVLCCGCSGPPTDLPSAPASRATAGPAGTESVERVLDDWHAAASDADEPGYLGPFADDGVFLGTDPGERWTVDEFRAFVKPYFSAGRGWTYVPFDRHVSVARGGDVAWFDEKLRNDKYGELRGTGVLRRVDGEWRIAHYSMSFPIPNERTADVVQLLRPAADDAERRTP
jgi:ketosteroid isomerase-like protein